MKSEQRKGSIVGRRTELEELGRGLDDAKSGKGRLYVLAGEGGIGKTRLATEIARIAGDRGFTVAWGRCAEVGGAPSFWPWIQILRTLRRRKATAATTTTTTTNANLERLLPELRGGGSGDPNKTAVTTVVDPSQARLALFEDVVDALRDVTDEKAPLCLLFEDLHAADPSSLALVHFLARDLLTDAHVFVLVTYRDQEVRAHEDRGEAVHRIAREAIFLPLRRFDATEVRELLECHAPSAASVTIDVVDRVLATTEGNALFVEEVARAFASSAEPWVSADHLALPTGVRDAIGKRLSQLDASTHDLLAIASVMGREIDAASIAALIDQDAERTGAFLERAAHAGVLVSLGSETYAFSHVLIRDVLYRELPSRRRADLHAKLAEFLTRSNAPQRAAAEIAAHLIDAIDAVGPERALVGSLEAARRSAATFAFEDVVAILERALHIIPASIVSTQRTRAECLILLGEARLRMQDIERGRSACIEGAAFAKALGDPHLLASAALACGAEIVIANVDSSLITLLRDALAALPDTDAEMAVRARLLARLAGAEQPATDPSGPIQMAREAIALARRSGDRVALRMVLYYGGAALVDYADPHERKVIDLEMRDLAIESGEVTAIFRAQLRLFFDYIDVGDRMSATTCADEIEHLVTTKLTGKVWGRARWQASMVRACLAATRGSFERALELRDQASSHATYKESELLFGFGLALVRDRPEEIAPIVEQLRHIWDGNLTFGGEWLLLMTSLGKARLGDLDGARAALSMVPRDSQVFRMETGGVPVAAEVVVMLGDVDWAAALLPSALGFADRVVSWGQHGMFVLYPFRAIIGMLESTIGRVDDAFASFELAEQRARAAGMTPALAWTFYWHACARSRAKRAAKEHWERAINLAKELGLDRLETRIRASMGDLEGDHHASPSLVAEPSSAASTFTMVRDGEIWTIATAQKGKELRLKDSRGIRMLARLIDEPGREMHVMILAGEGADAGDLGSAGDVIDAAAMKAYRGRIENLRDCIEEAEGFNDNTRADKHREELDFLIRELAAGVGLGGRSRKAAVVAERARVNVQRRLKDAIKRVGEQSPELGEYLGWTIRTGTFCSYRPAGTKKS